MIGTRGVRGKICDIGRTVNLMLCSNLKQNKFICFKLLSNNIILIIKYYLLIENLKKNFVLPTLACWAGCGTLIFIEKVRLRLFGNPPNDIDL